MIKVSNLWNSQRAFDRHEGVDSSKRGLTVDVVSRRCRTFPGQHGDAAVLAEERRRVAIDPAAQLMNVLK